MHKNRSKKILNLGCGVGIYYKAPYHVWGSNVHYINVDKFLDEKKLRKGAITKKGSYANTIWEKGAKYIKADILHLPFPDNYADGVEMHQVIEHFSWWDQVPAMKEIRRVMKKGAKFIMTAPNFNAIAKDWVENCWYEEFIAKHQVVDIDTYIELQQQIFGNQVGINQHNTGEMHKCAVNPRWIQYILSVSGFKRFKIVSYAKGTILPKNVLAGTTKPKNAVTRFETMVAIARK